MVDQIVTYSESELVPASGSPSCKRKPGRLVLRDVFCGGGVLRPGGEKERGERGKSRDWLRRAGP